MAGPPLGRDNRDSLKPQKKLGMFEANYQKLFMCAPENWCCFECHEGLHKIVAFFLHVYEGNDKWKLLKALFSKASKL